MPTRTRRSRENVEEKTEKQAQENKATTEKPMEADDATDDTQNEIDEAKELFTEGKRNYRCGNVAEAAKCLTQVCQIFGEHYGETALECAEPYFYYGRTLLELARKEPDVVANAVQGVPLGSDDSSSEAEDDQADNNTSLEQVREDVMKALDERTDELENGAAPVEKPIAGDGASGGDMEAIPEDLKDETENGMEEETNGGVPEEISNLQLAWEMLDLARVIYEKHDDQISKERLAECRLALGEQAMEDEQYPKAIDELEACVAIQKQLFSSNDRRIAVSYFNMGVTYNLGEKYEEAVNSFKLAITVLESRRSSLMEKMKTEGLGDKEKADLGIEIDELISVINDVQARIQDSMESQAEAKTSKDDLKKFDTGGDPAVGSSSTDKAAPASDVSHLVHKPAKRTSGNTDTQADADLTVKKAKLDKEDAGDNGHGEEGNRVENTV